MIQTISVTGMTCQNCVRHVSQALNVLPGVRSVEVDLEQGAARLDTEREIPQTEIRAALDEAGYELA
ncbi:MAG TPA: heavy metal-associated domain-containing protein [Candidatus Baltobacteraceae bacterium]|nr:heavy metal-associated domain-containing protein [Candidatus Baltobacteraceae bacterium]